jgi:hypothetical protein
MRLSERLGALMERQTGPAAMAMAGEDTPVRPGAFKVSSKILKMWEKDAPAAWKDDQGKLDLSNMIFDNQRALLKAIPREDLPALVGADNIPDAQDVLANRPREAFKQMLCNVAKVAPKAARLMRAQPENMPIYWYLLMVRLSGRDMADLILQRYFSTAQAFAPAAKKFEAVEDDEEDGGDEDEDMGDEGVCPVTGEPRACEARDESDGAACEACEGPEDDDEEMDAAEASEAVGHWVAALVEAAAKKKKASKQQQLSAKYLNPKTGAFKGRKGEKFGNCVKYMKAKGGVSDPKALCGTIARKKAGAMGEAAGDRAPSERTLEGAAKAAFRRAGMAPWAEGTSKEWLVFVNKDHGPAADSQAFVTLWKGRKGWQMISGVPQAAEAVLLASPSATTSGQSAKKNDALMAAADGKRALNQNYLLAVAKEVEGDRFLVVQQRMGRVIDIGPKGTTDMGEAIGWALAESAEVDPRQMIEGGEAMLKVVEGRIDALRKGVVKAQAELKGYARIGVPGRAASALLKAHLLGPAEALEDMAKKVRESIEEGIKVFG